MMSSAAMSISSIIVVLISNLMRFVNIDPSKHFRIDQNNETEENDIKVATFEIEKSF